MRAGAPSSPGASALAPFRRPRAVAADGAGRVSARTAAGGAARRRVADQGSASGAGQGAGQNGTGDEAGLRDLPGENPLRDLLGRGYASTCRPPTHTGADRARGQAEGHGAPRNLNSGNSTA